MIDLEKINPKKYFSELIIEFPILKKEIESEEEGMTHFRMEIFSDYNIEKIKAKDYSELNRCFEFQESRIDKMNAELINALNASYCESLLLGEYSKEMIEIRKLMTPKLKKVYDEYAEYYAKLTNNQ